MHFVGAVASMGTVKLKIGVVNKTTKAFLVVPQLWLSAREVMKYYTHVQPCGPQEVVLSRQ